MAKRALLGSGLRELQSIPARNLGVEAPNTVKCFIPRASDAGAVEDCENLLNVLNGEGGMRFCGWPKMLFHAAMQLP